MGVNSDGAADDVVSYAVAPSFGVIFPDRLCAAIFPSSIECIPAIMLAERGHVPVLMLPFASITGFKRRKLDPSAMLESTDVRSRLLRECSRIRTRAKRPERCAGTITNGLVF